MRRYRIGAVAVLVVTLGWAACGKQEVTAPALGAGCLAQPASGPAPLLVRFVLSVSGAEGPFSVEANYGDGTSGSDPDAPHTYAAAGTYTASFTVSTATQSARCAASLSVGPSPSPSPEANQPPQPVFKTVPGAVNGTISGSAPFAVKLNMCMTSDPEHDLLWFSMDFDGDERWDVFGTTGANCRKEHVYSAGTYRAKICVHDRSESNEPLHDDQCRSYTVEAAP